jgi:hypothetical protein
VLGGCIALGEWPTIRLGHLERNGARGRRRLLESGKDHRIPGAHERLALSFVESAEVDVETALRRLARLWGELLPGGGLHVVQFLSV